LNISPLHGFCSHPVHNGKPPDTTTKYSMPFMGSKIQPMDIRLPVAVHGLQMSVLKVIPPNKIQHTIFVKLSQVVNYRAMF